MKRRQVADVLKAAACSYALKKGYSCFTELGLNSWGKLRGDVICLNLRCHILLFEIKSSVQDYATDTKWRHYLEYSNKMYFVFSEPVYEKLKDRLKVDLKGSGVGVLILCPKTGYLKSVISSKNRKMAGKTKKNLVVRMAWRSGFSKRDGRRVRHFIEDEESGN
jgi:hypothetical protein